MAIEEIAQNAFTLSLLIALIVAAHIFVFVLLSDRLDRREARKLYARELETLNVQEESVNRLLNLQEDPNGLLIRLPLQQTPFPARLYAEDKQVYATVNETMFSLCHAIGSQRLHAMYGRRGPQ